MSCAHLSLPGRRDPVVSRIVTSWRRLTGGGGVRDPRRRTVVACSGGADSSALVLALATVTPGPVVAHILHDMRPEAESEADRDRVRLLCDTLGLGFVGARAGVDGVPGNTEANARRARYRALAACAREAGCDWVATGHHADDQLETVLMRLMRGAGARGLGGIRPVRAIGEHGVGVRAVRPMLGTTHDEARELCRRCGWAWAEDRTNRDESRLRAALRARVLPELREIDPGVAGRVSRSASAVRSAHAVLEDRARLCEETGEWLNNQVKFDRELLRNESNAVLVVFLTRLHTRILGGGRQDRLGQRVLSTCIGVLKDSSGARRAINVGGLRMLVSRNHVEFS